MTSHQQEYEIDKKGDIPSIGVNDVDNLSTVEPVEPSKFKRIYRSALFQMCVVGALAFTGPAMADAISGLGGGGAALPWTVNAATAASYSAVALVSLFGGPIVSTLGVRWALVLGAMTFPINGSSYYVNSRYGIQWYLIFGRTIYGIGFGLWYVAEAAIILSYPEDHRRGVYLAIWVMSRNLGQLVGGSISLSRSIKNAGAGAIATSTYLIFVAIECVGFPVSFLISHPSQVKRADGTKVIITKKASLKEEMMLLKTALLAKRNLCLFVYFFYSYFYGGVLGSYLTLYFSVRARALSSFIVPCGVMVGCALLGLMLDSKQYDQRRRAQMGFAVVVVPSIAWFCWLCVEQQNFLVNKPAKLDWTSAGWASAYIPFFLMQIWGYLCQTYIYWLVSCFSSSVQSNARQGGVFRCVEAIGQAVSYGINSHASNRFIPLGINFGLLFLAIPGLLAVVQTVPAYRSLFQEGTPEYEQEKIDRAASEGKA